MMQCTGTLLRNVACFRLFATSVRACDVVCPLDTAAFTELWPLDFFLHFLLVHVVFVEIVQPNNEKNVILGCYIKPLMFRLKSLMMKLNKSLLKLALRINYVSFLVTLTSKFLMLTHMSLLMISLISCIPMVSILLSLNQQGSRLIQLL